MGQLLHKRARTTQAIRRDIQMGEESIVKAARRFNVNKKTMMKWRARDHVDDLPMGPKVIRSTVLTEAEEQAIVAFRQFTQLPLDDVLYTLQKTIPNLTRASLHRCLQRHGISRLPKKATDALPKKKFKAYAIGYFHVDIAQLQTQEGRLYLFVGIDRTSKFTYAELHPSQTGKNAAAFLENLMQAVPYKIHTVLTDNGAQFTRRALDPIDFEPLFATICRQKQREHRKTKIRHPWTNGQVERMNKTIKEATVKTYYYQTHKQLKSHLHDFLMAYHFAKRLKAIKGKTPWQFIQHQYQIHPDYFFIHPDQFNLGLNTG